LTEKERHFKYWIVPAINPGLIDEFEQNLYKEETANGKYRSADT